MGARRSIAVSSYTPGQDPATTCPAREAGQDRKVEWKTCRNDCGIDSKDCIHTQKEGQNDL